MYIQFLKAGHGDAILLCLQHADGSTKNILIDGGPKIAYEYRDKRTKKKQAGALKIKLEEIFQRNEKIDLLILTHVDDDHIGGILKWFENKSFLKVQVGKIWFNSGQLISEYFNSKDFKENHLSIEENNNNTNTSINQGATFEKLITKYNLWDRKIINAKDELKELGLTFKILSPNNINLKKLIGKWKKERPDTLTSGKKTDYHLSLNQLNDLPCFEDTKPHNGSSIAFLLTHHSRNYLFLGDAHPKTIIESLKHYGFCKFNPLKVELVKISHHGSKFNTNKELLEILVCNHYVISTNGNIHQLPDKECLARIISNNPKVSLYFNFPEQIKKIFTPQDYLDYPNFKTHSTDELNFQNE